MEHGIYSVDLHGAIEWARYLADQGSMIEAGDVLVDTFPGLDRDVAGKILMGEYLYTIRGNELIIW